MTLKVDFFSTLKVEFPRLENIVQKFYTILALGKVVERLATNLSRLKLDFKSRLKLEFKSPLFLDF